MWVYQNTACYGLYSLAEKETLKGLLLANKVNSGSDILRSLLVLLSCLVDLHIVYHWKPSCMAN